MYEREALNLLRDMMSERNFDSRAMQQNQSQSTGVERITVELFPKKSKRDGTKNDEQVNILLSCQIATPSGQELMVHSQKLSAFYYLIIRLFM